MPYGENDPIGPEKVLDAAPSASVESFSPGLLDGFGESLYKAPLMVGARAALVAGETFTPPLRAAAEDLGLGKPVDDWLVEQRDITRKAMLDLQPKPGATGWVANNLMYGVGVPMAELLAVGVPTAIVTGSPQAGIATAAGYEGLATFHANRIALEAQGVDHDTATKLAGVQGGVAGAMALIPGTLMGKAGASVATNIARVGTAQAAVNVSAGAAQRAFTADFLQSHGYPEMAAQVHPFAVAEMITDAALGFTLGAYGGVHASRSLDAAMYANSAGHASFDTMRGAPVDINAINAHADAMAKATDDLLNGRPVDVPREGEYIPAERPEPTATRTGATIEGEQTQPALPAPTRRLGYEPVPEVVAAHAEYLDHVNAELDAASREIAAATSTESAPAFSVEHMRAELGWAERGGHVIRATGMEGDVVGRTAWIPHSDFWPNRPDKRLTEKQAHVALDKVASGERLTPKEERFVDYAIEVARRRDEAIAALDAEAAIERAAIQDELMPVNALDRFTEGAIAPRVSGGTRVAVTARVRRAQGLFEKGEDAAGKNEVRRLLEELTARNDERAQAAESSDRVRGADWVRERLLRARRSKEIPGGSADLALWLLDQNPALASGLAVSVRQKYKEGAAGSYNPAERLITLVASRGDDLTATHEILHHAERMMPPDVQAGIRAEWAKQLANIEEFAQGYDVTALRRAVGDIIRANMGDTASLENVTRGIHDGVLPPDFYQYVNPSEFWAENASRLMRERAGTAGDWVAKARQWLKELIEKIKAAFGFKADAAVLTGLRKVLDGTGDFKSAKMLLQDEGRTGLRASMQGVVGALDKPKGTEPAGLTRYTNADILQREADSLAQSKRDTEAKRAADAQVIADAQRDAFRLTGSDRAADQNADQGKLFSLAEIPEFERPYPPYPGTHDDPMPSASHLAAADARVAEAEKSADKATAAAVECAKVEEQNA